MGLKSNFSKCFTLQTGHPANHNPLIKTLPLNLVTLRVNHHDTSLLANRMKKAVSICFLSRLVRSSHGFGMSLRFIKINIQNHYPSSYQAQKQTAERHRLQCHTEPCTLHCQSRLLKTWTATKPSGLLVWRSALR